MTTLPPGARTMGAISMPAAARPAWKSYGMRAAAPAILAGVPAEKAMECLLMRERRRKYVLNALQTIFLPWLLFTGLFACLSFKLHFLYPSLSTAVAWLTFALVVGVGALAWRDRPRTSRGEEDIVPRRHVPLFVAMAIAWILAMVLGNLNYRSYIHPFYQLQSLNTYPNVDPSQVEGKQVMDGGIIHFSQGSMLDLNRSMGFKNEDVYCVAPITLANQPASSYDYWAVGFNCCTGDKADFKCGQYANKYARSGLRLMEDDKRPFLRLAVQQAEAQYGIKAAHPNFYYWAEDPAAELSSYWEIGYSYFSLAVFVYFGLSLLYVAIAMASFSWTGYSPEN